jgi:hypothetical protein
MPYGVRPARSASKVESFASMSSRGSTLILDDQTIRVQETHIRKQAWWMLGVKHGAQPVETHVILDRLGDVENIHESTQSVKLSRLGRLDSYL